MIADSLLPEFDQEMANTRKVIARVPNGKSDWKPHPKSMPLGYMTVHISRLPNWVNMILEKDELDIGVMMKSGFKMPDFESADASVAVFDQAVKDARAALAGASDALLMKPWTFKKDGVVVFTVPKIATMRTMVFNHLVHHRAQLTVYLRLNDVPVPGIYGPSADEPT